MASRTALGRGLKALIPDTSEPLPQAEQRAIQFLQVAMISPNPFQPRELFDPEKMAELKRSIAEKGLVQPITVRRWENGYQLIAGERRLRSVRDLGISDIPAYILNVQTDEEMLELSIIENIHREDLNPIDIAHGYKRLLDECKLTQEEVAQKVGKDRATVANFLRLLKLPKRIQESTQSGELSMGHARALLALESTEDQVALWQKILKEDLSVRKVEQLAKKMSAPTIKAEQPTKSFYIQDLENRVQQRLATKVEIRPKVKGGSIEIQYYDNDDLDRLFSLLTGE